MTVKGNKKYATFDGEVWGARTKVNVGTNKTLHRISGTSGIFLQYKYHREIIMHYSLVEGRKMLALDNRGYLKPSTRASMEHALYLFDLTGSISFAGGEFVSVIGNSRVTRDIEQTKCMLLGWNFDSRVHHHIIE